MWSARGPASCWELTRVSPSINSPARSAFLRWKFTASITVNKIWRIRCLFTTYSHFYNVCPVSAEEFETTLVNNNLQRSSFSLSLSFNLSISHTHSLDSCVIILCFSLEMCIIRSILTHIKLFFILSISSPLFVSIDIVYAILWTSAFLYRLFLNIHSS